MRIAAVLILAGLLLVFFAVRIFRPTAVNTAEAITSEEFDPLKEYEVIIEKGNANQKVILLNALTSQRQQGVGLPVLTDLFRKIITASNEVLAEETLPEKERISAAMANLDAVWKLYLLNIQNDVDDPFVADQYRDAIDRFITSKNKELSQRAHVGRLRYFTGEIITQRNTNLQKIADVATDSLNLFPADQKIIDGIRRSHSQLIAVNPGYARVLSDAIIARKNENDSPEFLKLVQHCKDLTVLYELKIGNLPSITDISTSLDDFCSRINKLAVNTEIGETVYRQLSNAIVFLEKKQHSDRAVELGKLILQTAQKNPNQQNASMGQILGERCVKRNSLVNGPWQFEENGFSRSKNRS